MRFGVAVARARGRRLGRPPSTVDADKVAELRAQGASWPSIEPLRHALRCECYKLSKDRSTVEPTPTTNRNIYEPVGGTPAKRNKITGEIWERDKSRHGGEHYEVYKNMRDFKNRKRDRAVWQDGRLKEKF